MLVYIRVRVRVRALQYNIPPVLLCKSDWDLKGLKSFLLLFFVFFCASHQTRDTLLYTIIFNIHEKRELSTFSHTNSQEQYPVKFTYWRIRLVRPALILLFAGRDSWFFSRVGVCFVHSAGRKEACELLTLYKGVL